MDARGRAESAPGREDGGGATILVVDDEATVRRLIRAVLRREGHTVLEAEDGGSALAVWKEAGGANLVITDMVMPGMGGRALLRELFREDPTLPVIYISGDPAEVSVQRAGALGTVGYLQKPFDADDLTALVGQLLARG